MELDHEFERSLRRMRRILRKMIFQSEEFRELRSLLKQGKVEMRLFLVPILFQHEKKNRHRTRGALRFQLTEEDKRFLKNVGIKF